MKKLSSCWHEKTWPSCDVTVTELAVCSWKTTPRRWSRSTSVTPVTPWACNMWRIMDGHVGWLHKEGYISLWENKPAMDNDTNGLPTFWPLGNVVCSAVVTGHIWNSGHSRSSMVTWWWLYRRLLATRLSQPNLWPEGRSVHTKWFQRNGPATTDETIGLSAPLMIWPQTLDEQARVLVYRLAMSAHTHTRFRAMFIYATVRKILGPLVHIPLWLWEGEPVKSTETHGLPTWPVSERWYLCNIDSCDSRIIVGSSIVAADSAYCTRVSATTTWWWRTV